MINKDGQLTDALGKAVTLTEKEGVVTMNATTKTFIVWAEVEGIRQTLSGTTMHVKNEGGETYFSVDESMAEGSWWPSGLKRELAPIEIMMIAWSNRRDTNNNLVPIDL